MKHIAALFVFFVCFVFFLFGTGGSAHASGQNLRTNPDVAADHKTYTQSTVIELLVAISCSLTGIDPIDSTSQCLGIDPQTRKLGYVENGGGGLVSVFGNMIGGMYQIPVSSHDYIAYTSSQFGIVKDAHAQDEGESYANGIGFSSLQPLTPIWEVFRNLVYIFFVIAFIVIGLAIMFRLQINPQTTMSLQNQIPKVLLVIVLVTLSYAIAGFMIDLMYLFMYFIFETFSKIEGTPHLNPSLLQGGNPLNAVGGLGGLGSLAGDASLGLGEIIASIFDGRAGQVIGAVLGGLILGVVGSVGTLGLGGILGGIGLIGGGALGGELIGMLGTVIAFVVFAVALAIALVRLWWTLLKAYISILIATALAPVWIAASLLPGSPLTLSSWFRFMAGNILMFPAALTMFLFAYVFIEFFGKGTADFLAPPFVGNPNASDSFGALIAFGIVLMTPDVVAKVKEGVGASAGDVTSGAFATVSGAAGTTQSLVGKPWNAVWGQEHGKPKILTRKIKERWGATSKQGERSRLGTFLYEVLPGKDDGEGSNKS